jgi:transposase
MRTRVKNRIQGCLARYNVQITQALDVFSHAGRRELGRRLEELSEETRESVKRQLALLDFLEVQIDETEARLKAMMEQTPEAALLDTMPRVGPILSMVMALEIGQVERFPDAAHLASYSGLVPRVISSGGHTRMGGVSREANVYLKWAFVEAANLIAMSQKPLAGTHAVRLYQRVKKRKGHQKAVVAVGRHLAEAAYWILTKREPYREPARPRTEVSSTHG